jgi:hypothetical protein
VKSGREDLRAFEIPCPIGQYITEKRRYPVR